MRAKTRYFLVLVFGVGFVVSLFLGGCGDGASSERSSGLENAPVSPTEETVALPVETATLDLPTLPPTPEPIVVTATLEPTPSGCINASEVGSHIGEEVCVEYFVSSAFQSAGGHIFLDEKEDYKNGFVSVIFSNTIEKFDQNPSDLYDQVTVRVRGVIKLYQGRPEIIINGPDQVMIVD